MNNRSFHSNKMKSIAGLLIAVLLFVLSRLMNPADTSDSYSAETTQLSETTSNTQPSQTKPTTQVAQPTQSAPDTQATNTPQDTLDIHYLDIGHGAAVLLTCKGEAMMIDCGDSYEAILEKEAEASDERPDRVSGMVPGKEYVYVPEYLEKQGVSSLKYLILTHPDKDHIGGAKAVLNSVTVENIFGSDYQKENKTNDTYRKTLKQLGLEQITPSVGSEYTLGDATFTVLGPINEYEESNDNSLVILVEYEGSRFLFTGDAQKDEENDLVDRYGDELKADVLMAGHHGSSTSSKKRFLKKVRPDYVVVSCIYMGINQHPHDGFLERIKDIGAKIYRTDEQGTIVLHADKDGYSFEQAPSETWISGAPR